MSEIYAMAKVARQLVIQIGSHLESGNFGVNHNFGKNGENGTNGKNRQGLTRGRMWQIFKLDTKSGPLRSGDLGEIGTSGKKSPELRAGKIQNVGNIQIRCPKWPLGEWRFW